MFLLPQGREGAELPVGPRRPRRWLPRPAGADRCLARRLVRPPRLHSLGKPSPSSSDSPVPRPSWSSCAHPLPLCRPPARQPARRLQCDSKAMSAPLGGRSPTARLQDAGSRLLREPCRVHDLGPRALDTRERTLPASCPRLPASPHLPPSCPPAGKLSPASRRRCPQAPGPRPFRPLPAPVPPGPAHTRVPWTCAHPCPLDPSSWSPHRDPPSSHSPCPVPASLLGRRRQSLKNVLGREVCPTLLSHPLQAPAAASAASPSPPGREFPSRDRAGRAFPGSSRWSGATESFSLENRVYRQIHRS